METILQTLALSNIGLNWIDVIIIAVFFFYALEGFSVGFVVASVDLLSFLLSFIIGLRTYGFFASFLLIYAKAPHGFANAIGFFIAAVLSEILLGFLFRLLLEKISQRIRPSQNSLSEEKAYLQTVNKVAGFIPGIASAMILLTFLLTMIISLPFSPFLKNAVAKSKMGGMLITKAQGFEKDLHSVFGGAVNETINFLTVKPESDEFVQLNFKVASPTGDAQAEQDMLVQLNQQRSAHDLPPLEMESSLRDLSREYAKDMLERGYFSHYSPEGTSPFDRMTNAGISYTSAGENLALAPDTDLAMQGLMNSPGHRANILSPNYAKVGIGVMDGGVYGKMFVQEFSN